MYNVPIVIDSLRESIESDMDMKRVYICKITILGHLARKKQVLDSFLLVNPKKWTFFSF